jgi:hypothetical protein
VGVAELGIDEFAYVVASVAEDVGVESLAQARTLRWPQLPAWAKDHVCYREDEYEEVDPRYKEPASSAVAYFSGIMAGRSGEFGEPTPFRNEKGAANRKSGNECPDSDEQPRFGPVQVLTCNQDDSGDDQNDCRGTEDGLSNCFGVDGESIGHRIRGCGAHVARNDLEGHGGADPCGRCEDVQGQQQLIDAHPPHGSRRDSRVTVIALIRSTLARVAEQAQSRG